MKRVMITMTFLTILQMLPAVVRAQADANFSGTLVQEPCTLYPEDSEISVNFGSVLIPYLYANTRSPREVFRIRLRDCDTSLGNLASVQFTGEESPELPGMLAPGGTSTTRGVAIGLETLRGDPVPVNNPSGTYPLQDGESDIFFATYIQATPAALQSQGIVAGSLSTIATFEIIYE